MSRRSCDSPVCAGDSAEKAATTVGWESVSLGRSIEHRLLRAKVLRMGDAFHAIAIDYDGTLTGPGDQPSEDALGAIEAARRRGLRVLLVTGRILEELRSVFPSADLWFDALVAENGAVLSVEGVTRVLAAPVEFELDEALVARGIPFRRGQVLLATEVAHEHAVTDEIRRLGLECQISRNRGELMLLPPGISKGFGVAEALGDLGVSPHSAVAIGDGENDHALLRSCEIGVAVANAVPSLRRHADVVLEKEAGSGVADFLAGPVLRGDSPVSSRRWRVELGEAGDGSRVTLPGARVNLLVTGRSKSGKSFFAGMLAEHLIGLGYSLCIIDPYGEYAALGALRGVLSIGGNEGLPLTERVGRIIEHRFGSVVVDLTTVTGGARAAYVEKLLRQLDAERRATGLPHWIFWDEAHSHEGERMALMEMLQSPLAGCCLVTFRPHELPESARTRLDYVVALPAGKPLTAGEGPDPLAALAQVYSVELDEKEANEGDAFLFSPRRRESVQRFRMSARRSPHVRHWRKYLMERLPNEKRFLFRDEAGVLRGSGANVQELHQALRTCDASVLRNHVTRGDLSRWLFDAIQDDELASDVRKLEREFAESSRDAEQLKRFREAAVRAIERRYID